MENFEIAIMENFENMRGPVLDKLVEVITMLGEETIMLVLVIALWFAFDKKLAQKFFFVTALSLNANGVIKNIVKRPRPWAVGDITCLRPETATGYSFPSGHTQTFSTWSSAAAKCIKRISVWITVIILILAVACSRIYLGAHYPSDVIVGAVLGISFGIFGSVLFDKVANKKKLYLISAAVVTPFAVFFLLQAELLYEDFFKVYGMLIGLPLAVSIEEKYAPLDYTVVWWKKVLRILIGLVLALAVKEVLKLVDVFGITELSLIIHGVRYFALAVTVLGLAPILFKKCKM